MYAQPPGPDRSGWHSLAGETLLDVEGLRWWPPGKPRAGLFKQEEGATDPGEQKFFAPLFSKKAAAFLASRDAAIQPAAAGSRSACARNARTSAGTGAPRFPTACCPSRPARCLCALAPGGDDGGDFFALARPR